QETTRSWRRWPSSRQPWPSTWAAGSAGATSIKTRGSLVLPLHWWHGERAGAGTRVQQVLDLHSALYNALRVMAAGHKSRALACQALRARDAASVPRMRDGRRPHGPHKCVNAARGVAKVLAQQSQLPWRGHLELASFGFAFLSSWRA